MQSRYYDPQTGRFINADAISILDETKDMINGLNLYVYCNNNPIMYTDPEGYLFLSMLIALAISGLVTWGIGELAGSQVAGGIGSVINGGGAILTGVSLLAFGPLGWILGGILIAVGVATIGFGVNEIVDGATGTNYIQQWTGMSDEVYNGINIGLNVVSGIGQFAGNIGMRIASNKILNNIIQNPSKVTSYKLWQMKTYGKFTSQYNSGVMKRSKSNPGGGFTLTHKLESSYGYIQYHPGGSRWHFNGAPYWKVTSSYNPAWRGIYWF